MGEIGIRQPQDHLHAPHRATLTASFQKASLPSNTRIQWLSPPARVPKRQLSIPKMLSGANAFEISDIQEDQIARPP
jgi:hypothetical protein